MVFVCRRRVGLLEHKEEGQCSQVPRFANFSGISICLPFVWLLRNFIKERKMQKNRNPLGFTIVPLILFLFLKLM